MELLLPVLVGIGIAFGQSTAASIDYYASKYDHIDVETLLNNRRMVNYYTACMLSKGPCPPEGLEFKRILPEALKTNCLRCTEKQKTVTLRAIKRLKKEYPKVWVQLQEQWDPDDIFVKKFETSFNTRPIESSPEASVQILNRFGDQTDVEKGVENAISQSIPSTSTSRPTTTITTTKNILSTKIPSTVNTVSTTSKISVKVTTNKPTINSFAATTTKTTKKPRPNIAASIQATVSLGPKFVGDLVRGLGALGTRVVETGAEIAGVVLKSITQPL